MTKIIAGKTACAVAWTFVVIMLTATSLAQKWNEGDVLLGVGGGTFKVFHLSSPTSGNVVDTLSDGVSSPGATNGLALDLTWHPIGTDSGSGGNISRVVRFRLAPHDPNNPSSVSPVLSSFNSSSGSGGSGVNPQAVVTTAAGRIIVANAAVVSVFQQSGSPVATFPIANRFLDSKTITGIDISPSGSFIYYTSGGSNIRTLNLSSGAISTFATFTGQKLFGIRVLPTGGLIVAALANVLRFDGSGAITQTYTIPGASSISVLALDPNVQGQVGNNPPAFFWAASTTSGTINHVNLASGAATAISTGGSGVQSMAVYGAFAADHAAIFGYQPKIMDGTSATSLVQLPFGNDQLTITGYAFPSGFTTKVSVFASAFPTAVGASEGGLPCVPTTSGGQCVFWQIDTDPPLTTPALLSLKLFSTNGNVNRNARILRNEREDFTFGVANVPDPMGGSRSAAALHQVSTNAPPDGGCTYFPPVSSGTLNNPGNVTFRFQCSSLPGAQLKTLQTATSPRILILQFVPNAAPIPFFPSLTTPGGLTGGTCCTVNEYRYDDQSNTFVLNVDFSNVSGGTFLATTFDDSNTVQAFDVTFTVQK